MQSTSPEPHSLRGVFYAFAVAGGLAVLNFLLSAAGTAFWYLVRFLAEGPSRLANVEHVRADTESLRAGTQHAQLDMAEVAMRRFSEFFQRVQALSAEIERLNTEVHDLKLIAARVPTLDSEIQLVTAWNRKLKALLLLNNIEIPKIPSLEDVTREG